jgi:hypothetical protein
MIQIVLTNIGYEIREGHAPPTEPGGRPRKVRILHCVDAQSNITVDIPFDEDAWQDLLSNASDNRIDIRSTLPADIPPPPGKPS